MKHVTGRFVSQRSQTELQPATDSDKSREAAYPAAIVDYSVAYSKYLFSNPAFHTVKSIFLTLFNVFRGKITDQCCSLIVNSS